MKVFLIFAITFFISFAGSVHPGPLNLSVIQNTLKKNIIAGLWMTFGGVIPEIIYGYLAVTGVQIFEQYPVVFVVMQWAVLPILLLVGYNYLKLSKSTGESAKNQPIKNANAGITNDIFTGFLLSLLNPQLLPFWIIILINYQHYDFLKIEDFTDKLAFVMGASGGAFLLNYCCAYVANRKKVQIFESLSPQIFDKIMGWTFIGIALIQMVKLLLF